MKTEFLARSPLLVLPLVALFLFIAIFAGIFVLTMRKKAPAYEPIARLPLGEDDDGQRNRGERS
jgi:hypothetical protein